MIAAPHGAICAALLPSVMEINIRALQKRHPDSKSLERYKIIAQILTNKPDARAEDVIEWIQQLCKSLKIPSLNKLGLMKDDFPEAITKARKSSSMRGNPIGLEDTELAEILEKAFY